MTPSLSFTLFITHEGLCCDFFTVLLMLFIKYFSYFASLWSQWQWMFVVYFLSQFPRQRNPGTSALYLLCRPTLPYEWVLARKRNTKLRRVHFEMDGVCYLGSSHNLVLIATVAFVPRTKQTSILRVNIHTSLNTCSNCLEVNTV